MNRRAVARMVAGMLQRDVSTPFGDLSLTAIDGALVSIGWGRKGRADKDPVLDQAHAELQAYIDGTREGFQVPWRVDTSLFQSEVCAAIAAIPFGETRTYGDLAKVLGVTPQAVGQACGANPIPIVIPCHRVMGAGGKLVGFSGAGGVETKVALLRHEKAGGFLL